MATRSGPEGYPDTPRVTVGGHSLTQGDWSRRKVDSRCRECGATSAGSSRCYRCGSRDLDYRLHSETPPGETMWCRMVTADRRTAAS